MLTSRQVKRDLTSKNSNRANRTSWGKESRYDSAFEDMVAGVEGSHLMIFVRRVSAEFEHAFISTGIASCVMGDAIQATSQKFDPL